MPRVNLASLHQPDQPLRLVLPNGQEALAPALRPHQLGDAGFRSNHGVRANLMSGAMANGIASTQLVIAMGQAGFLGSYGAGGQSLHTIEAAITTMQAELAGKPFAVNLLHAPGEPRHEMATVELLLRKGVHLIEASAFLGLSLAVVRYRISGLKRGADGSVVAYNRIIAKASRVEVAARWLAPAPAKLVQECLDQGWISAEQAELSQHIAMADDLTAEADSGGHTDNRPLVGMLPSFLSLAERARCQHGYPRLVRVGAGGGIGTPHAAAAAFALGAAYVVTGSINQACVESGTSDTVRKLLAQVEQADVTMAPAADMFEMGVKLQVIKRGTLFPMRALKLWELYRAYDSLEAVPAIEREKLEQQVFRRSWAEVWRDTEAFWLKREPAVAAKARQDSKLRMALVFRWYLGLSSRWANAGEAGREMDYQIWAGPALGAFNEWCKDSFLAQGPARRVAIVSANILHGAAVQLRIAALKAQGAELPPEVCAIRPRQDVS